MNATPPTSIAELLARLPRPHCAHFNCRLALAGRKGVRLEHIDCSVPCTLFMWGNRAWGIWNRSGEKREKATEISTNGGAA